MKRVGCVGMCHHADDRSGGGQNLERSTRTSRQRRRAAGATAFQTARFWQRASRIWTRVLDGLLMTASPTSRACSGFDEQTRSGMRVPGSASRFTSRPNILGSLIRWIWTVSGAWRTEALKKNVLPHAEGGARQCRAKRIISTIEQSRAEKGARGAWIFPTGQSGGRFRSRPADTKIRHLQRR